MMAATLISAQTGLPFDIELKSGPSTGYQWQLPSVPEGIELLGSEYRQTPGAQIGDPATQVFHLRANRPGRYSVRFVLKRNWESDHIHTTVIEVEVQ